VGLSSVAAGGYRRRAYADTGQEACSDLDDLKAAVGD
jgi:hypothetical protein